MSRKAVILRALARKDIDDALDHYLAEAGSEVAARFVGALEKALGAISANVGIGSLRFGEELKLPGLRTVALKRFPYLVFYVSNDLGIDVWRVLHARRDIPLWLQVAHDD